MSTTAGKIRLLVILAVFLWCAATANGQSIDRLEHHLQNVIDSAIQSIVTVEAGGQSRPGNRSNLDLSPARSLISTGVIVDSVGNILTSARSISGFQRLVVWFNAKPYTARLVGIDYLTGLAMIRASQPIGRPVTVSPEQLLRGKLVVAIGNSYGLSSPGLGFCVGYRQDGTLQFTAPVSSGSVGGGLFAMDGRLVGIVISGIGGEVETQTGAAIPAFKLPEVCQYLVRYGDRKAGYLGIQPADIEYYESDTSNRLGVYVASTVERSPAHIFGLRAGDVIIDFNSRPVTSANELMQYVQKSSPGTMVTLRILRNNQVRALQVTLGEATIASPDLYREEHNYQGNREAVIDSIESRMIELRREMQKLEAELRRIK
ncbi:MAG: serine protease [candidate division Zixibacteria bacterium]|nr:serine protease [candidate division Zixibacteria bacterium]